MKTVRFWSAAAISALASCAAGVYAVLSAAAEKPAGHPLAPAAARAIDFRADVVPILAARCVRCHAGESARADFRMDTRETFLRGGDSGEVVSPGQSDESYLIDLVAGREPKKIMPMAGQRLSTEEVGVLRAWIDQGLKWEAGFDFDAQQKAGLAPRRPTVPAPSPDSGLTHPVDLFLQPYLAAHGVPSGDPVDDRLFARRAHLDLVGLLPTPGQLAEFLADPRPDKRVRLVERLLSDRQAYATHWLTFWNDALRNAYRGTGYIDGGRRQITGWLYDALYHNKPYDQFVRELISPTPDSEGFVAGIQWRGVVNASQRREMQAAQGVAQVFLGTNLKCASCHDSFVNQWRLSDAYGLASAFADAPLEIHRCDKPMGETAPPRFIFPQLGAIDPAAPRPERMKQLADLIASPANGRLPRTIVNRLWARLFGRGLVEPLEDMDAPPWHRDLLDFLAADLQDHGYDLKRTLALMATSRAYQMPAVGAPGPDQAGYVFRGPYVRRMDAEQFADAAAQVAGVPRDVTPQMTQGGGGGPGGQLAAVRAVLSKNAPDKSPTPVKVAAHWIWSHAGAGKSDPGGRVFFRKTIQLDTKPSRAAAVLACDNEFVLYVNGRKIAAGDDWARPVAVDLAPHLVPGANAIAVEAINWPDEETGKGLQFRGQANPAGFVFFAAGEDGRKASWTVSSDATWVWRTGLEKGWEERSADTKGWKHAAELRDAADIAGKLAGAIASPAGGGPAIRAALADDDPLTRALGRPNREQVVTRRDSIATTLQALELTNGPTLDALLRRGAQNWLAPPVQDSPDLAARVYQAALGRRPNAQELAAAAELLGPSPTAQGVEDLLWAVFMLPEFQLIH